MIHEKMVAVPSFFLQQENTFDRRGAFQIFVSYNDFKRQGQKGSVYHENSAQGNRKQTCAGGLL